MPRKEAVTGVEQFSLRRIVVSDPLKISKGGLRIFLEESEVSKDSYNDTIHQKMGFEYSYGDEESLDRVSREGVKDP